uniref:IS3 family transposase n=1 Tax=Pyxidicoccus xibeiensis TaxID=2906759 RepID=UPI00389ACF26
MRLKRELVYTRSFRTREKARLALLDYIEVFYTTGALAPHLAMSTRPSTSAWLRHRGRQPIQPVYRAGRGSGLRTTPVVPS